MQTSGTNTAAHLSSNQIDMSRGIVVRTSKKDFRISIARALGLNLHPNSIRQLRNFFRTPRAASLYADMQICKIYSFKRCFGGNATPSGIKTEKRTHTRDGTWEASLGEMDVNVSKDCRSSPPGSFSTLPTSAVPGHLLTFNLTGGLSVLARACLLPPSLAYIRVWRPCAFMSSILSYLSAIS